MNFEDRIQSDAYFKAKKRVEEIKGFYWHLVIYILVNIFISSVKIIDNIRDGETFSDALFDFGTYAVWLFWGIGIFFHALGILNTNPLLGKKWEEKKLRQYMKEDKEQAKKLNL